MEVNQHPAHSKKHKKHKGGHHEEAHEGEGPWIVSYADLMTLLFCFFVIMTSFANFDPVVVAGKSEELAENFNPGGANADKKELEGLGLEIGGLPDLKGIAKANIKDGQLQIVFSSSIIFPPGDIELSEEVEKKIDVMIGLIKSKNKDYRIIVEGHTDKSPILPTANYTSNWDLSAARAAAIIERFEYYGYNSKNLLAVGYGDTRPVAPNFDKEGEPIKLNQSLNRRVVVKVLKPIGKNKDNKLNISNFFDDNEIL